MESSVKDTCYYTDILHCISSLSVSVCSSFQIVKI